MSMHLIKQNKAATLQPTTSLNIEASNGILFLVADNIVPLELTGTVVRYEVPRLNGSGFNSHKGQKKKNEKMRKKNPNIPGEKIYLRPKKQEKKLRKIQTYQRNPRRKITNKTKPTRKSETKKITEK